MFWPVELWKTIFNDRSARQLTDCSFVRLIDSLINWSFVWSIDRSIDRSIDWLEVQWPILWTFFPSLLGGINRKYGRIIGSVLRRNINVTRWRDSGRSVGLSPVCRLRRRLHCWSVLVYFAFLSTFHRLSWRINSFHTWNNFVHCDFRSVIILLRNDARHRS